LKAKEGNSTKGYFQYNGDIVDKKNEVKENSGRDSINRRLDAIIRLLIEDQKINNKIDIGQQILILKSAGLSTAEIASIIGVKATSIPSMIPKKKV
jgi:hypothetical protein